MDKVKWVLNLIVRYLILLAIAILLSFTFLFNDLFLKLTIYPVNFLISLFFSSTIMGNQILFNSHAIELIPACIGVSAYFLFLILNLSTSMNIKKRVYSLLFLFLSFLVINILRIFLLAVLFSNDFIYFSIIHESIWYFFNVIIVVGIWFLAVYLFKITQIPIYSDIKSILSGYKNEFKPRK